jgi:transposase-like protein
VRPQLHETRPITACPYCRGSKVIRKGVRENKFGDVQLFYCKHCRKKFTPLIAKHKSYPLRIILDALTLYNRLYRLEEISSILSRKYGLTVSRQNIRNWIESFRPQMPILRLRGTIAAEADDRRRIITETQLLHGLVYGYKFHAAKLDLLIQRNRESAAYLRTLRGFLRSVPAECPHHLFRQDQPRASGNKDLFDLAGVVITPRENAANAIARLVLQAVSNNKLRHEKVQEFMLVNDSVTVAVEVPVLLRPADLAHFRVLGYEIPLMLARGQALTGHIDIVQVRHGLIHILDFKPGAKSVKPIDQLTTYALALSRMTGIALHRFKCAWFDDEHYFDFYPRVVVEKRSPRA